jgi:hypothetical protein
MMIAPISTSGNPVYGQKPVAKKGAPFAAALDQAIADQVQLSESTLKMQSDEREALLAKVRGRMKSGYYNSDVVNEDLSDVLAKALDKTLQ